MSWLKNNRLFFGLMLMGVLLLVFLGVTITQQSNKKAELDRKHTALLQELNSIERNIKLKQADIDAEKLKSVRQATGLDPALISLDTSEAKTYFKPAFSWTNGDEYEDARQAYIKSLGKDNTFTKVYLPPDTKIDTDDGTLSYIDFKKVRATMDDLYIIPMTADGNRVRYVGFVQYYMHKNAKDLVDKSALNPSQAIVEFTVSGDASTGGRKISNVTARAGFSSSVDAQQ